MRKIIVRGRKEHLDKIRAEIERKPEFLSYFYEDRVEIYVADRDTGEIIKRLQESLDMRYRDSLIEVSKPEFVVSIKSKRDFEEKMPVEKLVDITKPYSKIDFGLVILTGVASIVALTGLLLNNSVIIIGAMLLAPLLGPIHCFAINLSVGHVKFAFGGIVNLIANLLFAVLLSGIVSMTIHLFYPIELTEEIILRTYLNPVYIIMAISLGFASILSLSKGIAESIAGVAVAASLLPPAVAAGVLLWHSFPLGIKAVMLTMENVAGLMVGSIFSIYVLGIRPNRYYERKVARIYTYRMLSMLTLLLILLATATYLLH